MGAFETNSGKVGGEIFKAELFPFTGAKRKEVISGPQFGVDTAMIELAGGQVLVTSSDPLSLLPALGMELSAALSVHLIVNDMATSGKAPQYAQFVLNLPPTLSKEDFQAYWQHIHLLCEKMEIAITGGHTGQIEGQNSSISGAGTFFLVAQKEEVLSSKNAQPGDVILVTKSMALSSTSILARVFPQTIIEKCGEEVQKIAAAGLEELSVLPEAVLASATLVPNEELHAMHDVTEGGVLGAISEMAIASGCGFEVEHERLPIKAETKAVAELFEIDPALSIGAGSMIMAVRPDAVEKLTHALQGKGIAATAVGQFTLEEFGQKLKRKGQLENFSFGGEDPYWEAFFRAFKAGWK